MPSSRPPAASWPAPAAGERGQGVAARLEGKVSLVTGGASGIGAAICRLFAAEGAAVHVADVSAAAAERLAGEIAAAGGRATAVRLDVRLEASWREALERVQSVHGRLDVLVLNAGISRRGPFEDYSVEAWDEMMAVNVRGVFLGCRTFIPLMRRQGGGSIVTMSSIAGLVGHRHSAIAYSASKGAVTTMTKGLASQYAAAGIRVNSLHPSTVETPLTAELFADPVKKQARLAEVPLGRLATVDDVARAALFLASDESSFITGVSLPVDGGLTCC